MKAQGIGGNTQEVLRVKLETYSIFNQCFVLPKIRVRLT